MEDVGDTSQSNARAESDMEKRLQKAMGRIFSSPEPSPSHISEKTGLQTIASPLVHTRVADNNASVPQLSSPPKPPCRPWDRSDLLKRLGTFKSMTWFGKPDLAGPVSCARHGWINVDLDMIACETCGARLIFTVTPSWSKQEVQCAAERFHKQLETGHKARCPWTGNPCSEHLLQFPPTVIPALIEDYNNRLEFLSHLSALPMISPMAIQQLKVSRGPEIERLFAQSPTLAARFLDSKYVIGPKLDALKKLKEECDSYYQAQKLISLCGWEPRILPYTVDYLEHNTGKSLQFKAQQYQGDGLKILFSSGKGPQETDGVGCLPGSNLDPASVVLFCGLCGASVGLWSFNTVSRPSQSTQLMLEEASNSTDEACANDVTECNTTHSKEESVAGKKNEQVEESNLLPKASGLDLSLTIAGGPPPTRLNFMPMSAPGSIPVPGLETIYGHHPSSSQKATTNNEKKTKILCKRKYTAPSPGVESRLIRLKSRRSCTERPIPLHQPVSGLPCCSSVNAMQTSCPNRQDNSPESVEFLPSNDVTETATSQENYEPSSTSPVEDQGERGPKDCCVENTSASGQLCHEASEQADSGFKVCALLEDRDKLDPVCQHRHFCPWINEIPPLLCGWQLTLDALDSHLRPHQKSESTASISKLETLYSVRKLLGGSPSSKRLSLEHKRMNLDNARE